MGEREGRQKHNEASHHNLPETSYCWHQHHILDCFIERSNTLWFFLKLVCIWESQIRNILYMESHMNYEGGEGQEESWKSTLRKEAKMNYSVSSGWNEGDENTTRQRSGVRLYVSTGVCCFWMEFPETAFQRWGHLAQTFEDRWKIAFQEKGH